MSRDLVATERLVKDLCCQTQVPDGALEALGDERIWGVYRSLVRKRLHSELRAALHRTRKAAGDGLFGRAFEQQMAQAPPRSRFFHGIVGDFAAFAVEYFRQQVDAPAHLPDLLAYEATLWAVGDADDCPPQDVTEFGFDACPLMSPTLRLLRLEHAVHEPALEGGGYAAREVFLAIHRRPEETRARTWTLNAITHDLMTRMLTGERTVSEAIRELATDRGIAVDEPFLEGLCSVLADFLERGVILGSR
ncbi:MAG: putative DNA-binding domain-containing protein [Myxococcales bacterium]|nr:putative DNA-binding domain-containing protein [Myxococcales bacterium]